jgi:hypothetical protein
MMPDKTAFQHLLNIARLAKPSAADEPPPEFRVPTAIEEEACMVDWETDIDATRIAWNAFLVLLNQHRFDVDDIGDLAKAIKRYGDERAESAIERYQEQGE